MLLKVLMIWISSIFTVNLVYASHLSKDKFVYSLIKIVHFIVGFNTVTTIFVPLNMSTKWRI